MRMSRFGLLLVAVAIVAVGVWAFRPAPKSPEDQVRAVVEAMAKGARDHEPSAVMDHVSESVHSSELGDKEELKAYVLGVVLGSGVVEARVLDSRAEALPGGEVLFTGRLFLGKTAGGLDLGQQAVQATFVNEDGTWRAVKAHVEPVP